MYIQPISNNINMQGKPKPNNLKGWEALKNRVKQKIIDVMPQATFEDGARRLEKMQKFDNAMSHPAKNRLIMGATALVTQPAIDYCNHKVDQETREVSRIRTISKIVAGATVGIIVRGSCYKLVEKMTNIKGKWRFNKALLPTKNIEKILEQPKLLHNYRSALSTGLAIAVMMVTNFLIDAPLTVFLTNHLNSKRLDKQKLEKSKEVLNG